MNLKTACANMNHGRLNVPIRFCPSCGKTLNISAMGSCNSAKHSSLLRNRFQFCTDCGKSLSALHKHSA